MKITRRQLRKLIKEELTHLFEQEQGLGIVRVEPSSMMVHKDAGVLPNATMESSGPSALAKYNTAVRLMNYLKKEYGASEWYTLINNYKGDISSQQGFETIANNIEGYTGGKYGPGNIGDYDDYREKQAAARAEAESAASHDANVQALIDAGIANY